MQKKSPDDLLSELLKKQEAIQNRIASVQARKRKDEDRVLTRKKILIGAYIIEKLKDKPDELAKFIEEIDSFLKRPNDRKLFDLSGNSD